MSVLDFPIIGNFKNVWFLRDNHWEMLSPPAVRLLNGRTTQPVTGVQYATVDFFNRKVNIIWKLTDQPGAKPRYLLAEYDAALRLLGTCVFATYHLPAQVTKDRAGTYWVTSQTALLRVFPQIQTVPLEAPHMLPQTWAVAQAADGQIWFASYGKGLARFDGLNVHPQPDFLRPFTHYDDGSVVDPRTGDMYFNIEGPRPNGLLRFDGQQTWSRYSDGTMATYLAYDKKRQLMRGTFYKGLWILPKHADMGDDQAWRKIDASKGLEFTSTIHTALEDSKGHYWMGHTNTGLACFEPKSERIWNWTKGRRTENHGVMSMAEDPKGNLWLGTDQGLFFLSLPGDMAADFDLLAQLRIVALDYLGESLVSVCRLYDEHTLIVANSVGFFLIDLPTFYANHTRVYAFTPPTGHLLGSINQNGIWVDREKRIWFVGSGGTTCFDPSLWVRDTSTERVHIDSVTIGNSTFHQFSSVIEVGSGSAFGKIWFSPDLNPQLLDNVRYRYRFSGDTAFSELRESGFFEFPSLAPGQYKFEVVAERNGIRSPTAEVRLTVPPVWWQNAEYWLLFLGAVIGIGALWRHRERVIARQNLQITQQQLQIEKSLNQMTQIDKEKDKLQVQTIVNQLNPHFINNALQWLQIRLGEDAEAVRVVGKLSENIGTVFKNSRNKKAYHSMRAEMKLAENYLFIQKSRFGDQLRYAMPDQATLTRLERVVVPLMVVQIHVENAVEHGIRNTTTGIGQIIIGLREDGPYAVITIEDDGVGRATAKRLGSEGTQQGVKMLKELETIHNRQNALPLEQHYENGIFVDADGRAYGTRVVVRIPKQYNFDL